MQGIFRFRGPIYNGLMMIANMIIVNMLFILTSLPIVTMGASFSALYATVSCISTENFTSISKEYFENLRNSFYAGTQLILVISLSFSLIVALLYVSVRSNIKILTFLLMFIISVGLLVTVVVFPIKLLFQGNYKLILKNSFIFVHRNTVLSIFVFLITVVFFIIIPIYMPKLIIMHLLFGFSLIAFIQTYFIKRKISEVEYE